MNIEIPISGQPANGGTIPPVQPQNPPIQPTSPPPPTPNPPSGGGGAIPPDSNIISHRGSELIADQNRMVADARREMQQRGVMIVPGSQNMNMFLQQYGQQVKASESQIIQNKYGYSRKLLEEERDEELQKNERYRQDRIEQLIKARGWQNMPNKAEEEIDNSAIGKKYRERKSEIYTQYNEAKQEIDAEEKQELKDVDKELTRAIKDLTRYFQNEARGNTNENSYVNKLRREYDQAIFERDNAEDEDEAREAARRANELKNRIKSVYDENEEKENESVGKDYGARILQMINGVSAFSSSIMNRSLGGMITGAGSVLTNVLPLSDENQATAMKWLSSAGIIGTLLQRPIEQESSQAGLAALMRGTRSHSETREALRSILWNYRPNDNESLPGIFDLGMDIQSFGQSAERRMSQSGFGGVRGLNQAYYQEALEKSLSLQAGSLGAAGIYDRYGTTSTDAIANLTSALMRDRYSGVHQGDYVRMEEYLRLQQGLMQGQLNFAGKPSYDYANEMISRFANFKGYQVDQRTGGDIQAVQNMVTNPANDRQKAILYSVVEQMFPETRGRMDLIERYTQDPEKMSQIQQGYIKRIQQMYGGTDTEMGYFAAKAALPGIGSAERRDAVWNGMQTNNFAPVSSGEAEKVKYIEDIRNYVNDLNEGLTNVSESLTYGIQWLVQQIEHIIGRQ